MNGRILLLRWRRLIASFGIAAALLLPVGAQLHALSHALNAVQEAAHGEPLVPQARACEQCLLYVALDAALPAQGAAVPAVRAEAPEPPALGMARRATAFTAYATRAPPPRA
jgi:hypothetical protein